MAHVPGTRVSIWNRANNDLLQAIVEWGWLGAGLWLVMAGATVWMGMRKLANRAWPAGERIIWLGPLAALLAVMVHSLVDSPLQILAIQLYVVIFAAFVCARPVDRGAV